MKIFNVTITRSRGYALLMVLCVVGCSALVAASTINRTYTVASLNQRAKQYQVSMYAAEAAAEKVYARFRYDYLTGGDATVSNNLPIYRNLVPTSSENAHWANFQFSNAQGSNDQTYVTIISNKSYQVLDGGYTGLSGWRGIYRVISNARPTTGLHQVGVGIQQEIAVDTIPAFQFAIFYNGQLEFTQCAPLEVRGRTHANGPICMGAAAGNTLRFWDVVSTTSSIVVSNMAGYSGFATPIYNGSPDKTKQGTVTLNLPIGTNNTPAAVREIINMPPAGEAANSMMGLERYHNKAAVLVVVSNDSITYVIKDKGSLTGISSNITYTSSAPTASERTNLARVLPFLSLTNRFYDYRESKWVMPTQIDMGVLKEWLPTNSTVLSRYPAGSGVYPNIMYVNDRRTVTNLHAVRVANASIIPTNGVSSTNASGFTLATENPLYVWGNYNLPNSSHAGTPDTSATFPSSLISDAITVLSANWTDSGYGNGSTSLGSRNATSTTVNAAVIAGSVYTTGSAVGQFSGGVMNLTRLLESWSGDTLTLNSSIVNLYNSAKATTQFRNPGVYYDAPSRNFNFDTNFLNAAKLPPGTPSVAIISRYKWMTVPMNTVTYNGP